LIFKCGRAQDTVLTAQKVGRTARRFFLCYFFDFQKLFAGFVGLAPLAFFVGFSQLALHEQHGALRL
jgi:hypothetical protein